MLVRPDVSFVFSPAAAQLCWSTPKARQRFLTKMRTRAWRQRKKDAKKNGNQRREYRVSMWDTDVIALFNDMESAQWRDDLTHQDYRELGAAVGQQWIKLAGWVIEQAALSTIKKKNNRK